MSVLIVIQGKDSNDAYALLQARLNHIIQAFDNLSVAVVEDIESGKYQVTISDSDIQIAKSKGSSTTVIETGGAPYIGGGVHMAGGDFVGRDSVKIVRSGSGGDVITAQVSRNSKNVAIGKGITQVTISD
jgi:hypothetical protein